MSAYFELPAEAFSAKIKGTKVHAGIGWDPMKAPLSKKIKGAAEELIVGVSADAFDLNIAALIKHSGDTADELIYFGHRDDKAESIKYLHDNRTGHGKGEDEGIDINLAKIPANVSEILLFALIYDGTNSKQCFGQVENFFVQFKDSDFDKVLYRNEEDYHDEEASKHTVYIFGKLTSADDGWTFTSQHRFSDENTELDVIENL